MTRAGYAVLLAVICGGCTFESSCGKKKVKTKDFEATIKARTIELGLNPSKVDCGEAIEAKVGATFVCKVELDGEKTYDMNVTITGVDEKAGRVDTDPQWAGGRAVNSAKLEVAVVAWLDERFGTGVKIDCGEPLRFVPDDNRFTCDVVSGTYQGKATLIFKEGTSTLDDAQFEPHLLSKKVLEGILTPGVRENTSADVVVTCGDQALIPRPADGNVWCDIADAKQAAKIKVQVDDQNNIKRWDVAEPPK